MTNQDNFAARVLQTSAGVYAALATERLFDSYPDVQVRYGTQAHGAWKTQFQQLILELAAAVGTGRPALFEDRTRWTLRAFRARSMPESDLRAALESLQETLAEELPERSSGGVERVIESAIASMNEEPLDGPGLDPNQPNDRLALQYLKTVLEGDAPAAIDMIVSAVDRADDGHLSAEDALVSVLLPALREVGWMWHGSELTVAEEHFVTSTTKRAMDRLATTVTRDAANGKTVLIAAVAEDTHDVACHALSILFEIRGWKSVCLGSDMPSAEITRATQYFDADLVVLSATLGRHLRQMQETIGQLRGLERDVRIMVGGLALSRSQDLWKAVGADAYAPSIGRAVPLGLKLVS